MTYDDLKRNAKVAVQDHAEDKEISKSLFEELIRVQCNQVNNDHGMAELIRIDFWILSQEPENVVSSPKEAIFDVLISNLREDLLSELDIEVI